ncbi:hypothetical protein MUCCIDRAFT_106305 [Mucor lusitanicus CBS 277.49]|uniref:Tc1-like transposase DDE domain-containing protein n=1 Tax=Mucor lusitanicus CBS 277.49 TaxID=747725 RepID=A0A168N3Z3_MUCCL|nr:hypothetical protein MUCCIDRAFT_106305 [Mucor lusitanicus CBS 277.49]
MATAYTYTRRSEEAEGEESDEKTINLIDLSQQSRANQQDMLGLDEQLVKLDGQATGGRETELDDQATGSRVIESDDLIVVDKTRNRQYGQYTIAQKIDLISIPTCGHKVSERSRLKNIKAPQKRGPKKSIQLNNTHIRFIIDIIDRWTPTSLAATSEQVLAEFPGIKISKTPFYRFVRQHYRLSIKRLEPFVERRSSTRTIELRYNIVTAWLQDPNMDFEANCIFIDEAGFNLHTTRRQGWSPVGTQASTKLADRGQNISILGAISLRGVLGLTVRKAMRKPVGSEERRRDNGEAKTMA